MQRNLKLVAVVVSMILIAGCARLPAAVSALSSKPQPPATGLSAVYLAPASGAKISASDLSSHPSVLVVHNQRDLASAVETRTPIWIDKGAVRMVDRTWLRNHSRKTRCPVALIGYNSALYSFRETLPIVGIHGPDVDWNRQDLEPGFSVWMVEAANDGGTSGYLKGFKEAPTVSAISDVTGALLAGRRP